MSSRPKLSRGKIGIALAIGAIGFAAFILVGGIQLALNQQKRAQTGMNAVALQEAVESYFDFYSRLPGQAQEGRELIAEGREAQEFLLVLLAKDKDGKDLSRGRQRRFLIVDEAKHKNQGGLLYDSGSKTALPMGLYDSWGRPFHLRFSPYDKIEIPDPLQAGEIIRDKRVIVYSYGKDGKPGGGDDIKTW